MNWLTRRGGILQGDEIPLHEIAARFGTPCYLYNAAKIVENVRRFQQIFSELPLDLCYAVKANPTGAILQLLRMEKLGGEVVSVGELVRTLRAGFSPQQIIFTGVGKRADELDFALKKGVRAIVIESLGELELLQERSRTLGREAPVALRLHPALDPRTHPHISTGSVGSKFGLDPSAIRKAFARLAASDELRLVGLHVHLGSQIRAIDPYLSALEKLRHFLEDARQLGLDPSFLDLGGGFAISYGEKKKNFPLDELSDVLQGCWPKGVRLVLEAGRALVGNAGVLLTRVLYPKQVYSHYYVVVDAGMNDLIRPCLYDAEHRVLAVQTTSAGIECVDVVGPVCENADFLAKGQPLPQLKLGDLLAVSDVGSYGFAMSSQYNSRLRPAEVLLVEGEAHLVRKREILEDLWQGEVIPPCLA